MRVRSCYRPSVQERGRGRVKLMARVRVKLMARIRDGLGLYNCICLTIARTRLLC